MWKVKLLSALKDNFIALLYCENTKEAVVIDPSEAHPVFLFLREKRLELKAVLNTHHHADHIGGNQELKSKTGCTVHAPLVNQVQISEVDFWFKEGDQFSLGELHLEVFEIPGHTLGHIAFFEPEKKWVFAGDTLFSLGCGRLFEGSYEQMWTSLERLRSLPDETLVFCGHEYTLSNMEFALSLSPHNKALLSYQSFLQTEAESGNFTIPSTIAIEKKLNPFFKADDESFLKSIGAPMDSNPVKNFQWLREKKNHFK